MEDKSGNVIGYNTMIRTEKNKIALPSQKTEVPFINGKGFDAVSDIFYSGFKMGVIYKEKVTYFFNKEKLGVGEAASKENIANNVKLQQEILAQLNTITPQAPAEIEPDDEIPDDVLEQE